MVPSAVRQAGRAHRPTAPDCRRSVPVRQTRWSVPAQPSTATRPVADIVHGGHHLQSTGIHELGHRSGCARRSCALRVWRWCRRPPARTACSSSCARRGCPWSPRRPARCCSGSRSDCPAATLSIAPLMAPHSEWPRTTISLAPVTLVANSRLPMMSVLTKLPAIRAANTLPSRWSKTSSGGTREFDAADDGGKRRLPGCGGFDLRQQIAIDGLAVEQAGHCRPANAARPDRGSWHSAGRHRTRRNHRPPRRYEWPPSSGSAETRPQHRPAIAATHGFFLLLRAHLAGLPRRCPRAAHSAVWPTGHGTASGRSGGVIAPRCGRSAPSLSSTIKPAGGVRVTMGTYRTVYERSLEQPAPFWAEAASALHWDRPWDRSSMRTRPRSIAGSRAAG